MHKVRICPLLPAEGAPQLAAVLHCNGSHPPMEGDHLETLFEHYPVERTGCIPYRGKDRGQEPQDDTVDHV